MSEQDATDSELARRESNAREDELWSLAFHELRGPLNTIVGWAHILSEAAHDPQLVRQAAETISRNARHQELLIGELQDLRRIDSGRFSVAREPVRLGEVVRAALGSLQAAGSAKQLRLTETIDQELVADGDRERLRQVVWQLVANAIKFTEPGGAIRLRLARDASDERRLELVVEDDGIGLDPASLALVFDRFWQASGPLGRQGLGLGLTIARHIVELHGGTIRAESAGQGCGMRVTVGLPALSRESAAPDKGNAGAERRRP